MKKLFIVVAVLVACGSVLGGGWGMSFDGVYTPVSVLHYTTADSGLIVWGYPDLSNLYDSTTLSPASFDSSVLYNDSLYLDSLGLHRAIVYLWFGASSLTDTITWSHVKQRPVQEAPTSLGSGTLCSVYGYLKDQSNNPLVGIKVTATNSSGRVGIDTSGGASAIFIGGIITYTDTAGMFSLPLRQTTEYTDTTEGFVDIAAWQGNEKMFELLRLYIPDTSLYDIGDSLLARGQR